MGLVGTVTGVGLHAVHGAARDGVDGVVSAEAVMVPAKMLPATAPAASSPSPAAMRGVRRRVGVGWLSM